MDLLLVLSCPSLVESIRQARVVRMDDYDYFVHPLTDGLPSVPANLLSEVVGALVQLLPQRFDRILAPEAMGLPLAAGVALATGSEYVVARKRSYGLPGEIVVPYRTGYSQGAYHLNGLVAGERLVVVDDVVSGGGTVRAMSEAAERAGATLAKVLLVFNKGLDLSKLSREVGATVDALVDVRVENGALRLVH